MRLSSRFLLLVSLVRAFEERQRRVLEPKLKRKLDELNEDDEVKVFIGYKSVVGREQVKALTARDIPSQHDFDEVNAVAVQLPKAKLKKLAKSSEIDYIEGNSRVHLLQSFSDQVPYGIAMSQNSLRGVDSFRIRRNPPMCNSSTVFKVAIIDSGVSVTHPDLACEPKSESSRNCMGQTFGLSSSDEHWHWHDAQQAVHGTHVAGTIGALANNQGIMGMIPDNRICYIFARVFGEEGSADFSDVLDAVRWTVQSGARVVNLSLGGADYEKTSENLLQTIHEQGVLIVGASGNDGGTAYNYPSAYPSVIAVAAVDEHKERAYFSQANDRVDIAAPGMSILSTIPVIPSVSGVITLKVEGASFVATAMLHGPSLESTGLTSTISFCENGAKDGCPESMGSFCLIERDELSFDTKAYNCQQDGGIVAVIYNNADGLFEGSLKVGTNVSIPAIALTRNDGLALLGHLGENTTITEEKGYGYLSGTSMAAPHVTGAIAFMWRSCPECSNTDVQDCLFETALDLGEEGKDEVFGCGLVQASNAYDCLKEKDCCSNFRKE